MSDDVSDGVSYVEGVAEETTSWEAAWERGRACLAGVERWRVDGASPGVELAVLDWGGQGDLVLLHHANGFCAATLAPIAQALRDRFRVVSIDGRGHGDSTSVQPGGDPEAYAWHTLAADLRQAAGQILARTGRARVALAIGHSFGGALPLRAASLDPGHFARLLLCDPVILPEPTPGRRVVPQSNGLAALTRRRRDRFPSRAAAFAHCRSRGLFADFTPEALALYVGEGMVGEGMVGTGTGEAKEEEVTLACPREVEAAIFEGGGASDLIADVESCSAEVVFLHAQRGNFSRERYEEVAARMPRARVAGVDAGHLFPLEQPDRVLAWVDALLADEASGAGAADASAPSDLRPA